MYTRTYSVVMIMMMVMIFGQACSKFAQKVKTNNTSSVLRGVGDTKIRSTVLNEFGAETATLSALAPVTQQIAASAGTSIGGTILQFPPGSLAVDTRISMEEGIGVANSTAAASLGIGSGLSGSGAAVVVQSSASVDPLQPFQLKINLPGAGLSLDDANDRLVVIYKIQIFADNRFVLGILPRSALILDGQQLSFSTKNFGVFQAAYAETPVLVEKTVDVVEPIQTKREVAELPSIVISGRSPFVVRSNEQVMISGKNFRPTMRLALGGRPVSNLKILSDSQASFAAPSEVSFGLAQLVVDQDGSSQTVSLYYKAGSADLPVITLVPTEVCSGTSYYDGEGKLQVGSKTCSSAAAVAACTADAEVGCVTNAAFKAADVAAVLPGDLRAGKTLAGISGTVASCASDGQGSCLVDGTVYVAAALSGAASKILAGSSLAGVTGNVVLPPAAKVFASTSFGVSGTGSVGTLTLPAASDVRSGAASYGIAGALLTPSLLMPAVANVRASDTVNGVAGGIADCSASIRTACFASGSFKTMNLSASSGIELTSSNFTTRIKNASNFEFWDATGNRHEVAGDSNLSATNIAGGVVIFGLTGTASGTPVSCSSDGQDNCFVSGGSYLAAALAGASSKLISGQTLAGVAGTVVLPTANKVLQGYNFGVSGTSMTGSLTLPSSAQVLVGSGNYGDPSAPLSPSYVPDYPSVSNVLNSDTVNGTAGTLTLPPAAHVSQGTSYGQNGNSTSGTLTLPSPTYVRTAAGAYGVGGVGSNPSVGDCSTDGEAGCFVIGPNVAAALITGGTASKILSGQSVAGVSGTAASYANCTAANQSNCVATTMYKTMDLSASSGSDLTAATFSSKLASNSGFQYWDSTGTRQTGNGNASLLPGNIKSGVSMFGVSGLYPSASYRLDADTGTGDLINFATQLTTNGTFEFFDSAGSRYTGSGDSDIIATNVKSGISFENLGVTGSYSASGSNCPSGYVKVAGDLDYGTGDTCVMKFEAKNVSTVPTSQAAGTPWISISQATAITSCRSLGLGYDLINNPVWMTAAAGIANQSSNWTSFSIGSGVLPSGHSDANPAAACAASTDDSFDFVETNCTPLNSGDTPDQKRTLQLYGSASMIWDLAGNVGEWVNYKNSLDKPMATASNYEYSAVTGTLTTPLKELIPTNAVKPYWNDSWTTAQGIGTFYPGVNSSGGAMMRGGGLNNGSMSGIFFANLNAAPTDSSSATTGFRCVYRPIVP